MDKDKITVIEKILDKCGREPSAVIAILHSVQKNYNYLPQNILQYICNHSKITPAAITGVSTFYSQFRHTPAGKHIIKICTGTACHVTGAETLYHAFRQHLNINKNSDTDPNKLFTIDKVGCLGCCMLAPAIQIDDIIYGHVTVDNIGNLLTDFLSSENSNKKPAKQPQKNISNQGEVRICTCSSCVASGSDKIYEKLKIEITKQKLPVTIKEVGCTGISYETPLLDITDKHGTKFRYGKINVQNIKQILERHFKPISLIGKINSKINRTLELLLTNESHEPVTRYCLDIANPNNCYCKSQIATEFAGKLAPLQLQDYLKHNGMTALNLALHKYTPTKTIQLLSASGLRGRGGGGFPTAKKWQQLFDANNNPKYIICNADEGDPGAFMDRMILESFPFRVLEGIIIAATTIGATEGILYIRNEYPLAIKRMQKAIQICYDNKYLGNNILNSNKKLDLKIVEGAGAFVCGEETALLAAIEGKRGTPRLRPPYPSQCGLYNKPTLINNAETLALVPWIVRNGAENFNSLGTKLSKGTKTFALAGKICNGGLIEVPMGMSLYDIIIKIGGGIPNNRKLKAVQIGGPSGGCIPASLIHTKVDYEALTKAGAIMGSGGLVILDEDDCMVDVAKYFMSFTQDESCGKCTFCRIGTLRMLEILERICNGNGKDGDIEKLEHLAEIIKKGSLCGLGKTAPNPVLSTIKYFREEFEAHIAGKCPAGKCKQLITYTINNDCIGCTKCVQKCPVQAIPLTPYEKHTIDPDKCVRCNTCRQICPVNAIEVN